MTSSAAFGLSSVEAQRRSLVSGPNVVRAEASVSVLRIFTAQFGTLVVWMLIGAAAVSALIGETADATAIAAVVLINGLVGFVQELRAERAIHALQSLTAPQARVLRDGQSTTVPARSVVDGDLLLLEAGDIIAADARLVEAHALTVNEAILTGESVPVRKSLTSSQGASDDRARSVFMATSVMAGTGKAVVENIGMKSELGAIARLVSEAKNEDTPLKTTVARLTRTLVFISCGLVLVIAAIALLRGASAIDTFLIAVSLAVAAVPEGLPAIVTVALALGVRRMAKRNVLVRKLDAVETLGCTTVICTDKTGTLTTGTMVVRELWGPDEHALLDAAAACCDAELLDAEHGTGDSTEIAILVKAAAMGIARSAIEQSRKRIDVHPFDDERRRMSILRSDGVLYVKGAVESVLPLCSSGCDGVLAANEAMASHGLRILAVATGKGDRESELHFEGLIGIADPPRAEAIEAVARARDAGVTTVMITGDHALTANAIAAEMGITKAGVATEGLVYARATPLEKLQIVRAQKAKGAIVAMTGDGVNDAPALREAHIGIAMGKGGTAVAREAADVVLADDNFASIVHGVREGRSIFDNIRVAVVYLVSGNAAELCIVLTTTILGWPIPLMPLQLLWINLVTDGMPALALVARRADSDVMRNGPRAASEPLLGLSQWTVVRVSALWQTTAVLALYAWALPHRGVASARSLVFLLVVLCELLRALMSKRVHGAWPSLRNEAAVIAVVVLSIGLQLVVQMQPAMRRVFQLEPLTGRDFLLCFAVAIAVMVALDASLSSWRLLRRLRA